MSPEQVNGLVDLVGCQQVGGRLVVLAIFFQLLGVLCADQFPQIVGG